jgi:hypothetical protein
MAVIYELLPVVYVVVLEMFITVQAVNKVAALVQNMYLVVSNVRIVYLVIQGMTVESIVIAKS